MLRPNALNKTFTPGHGERHVADFSRGSMGSQRVEVNDAAKNFHRSRLEKPGRANLH